MLNTSTQKYPIKTPLYQNNEFDKRQLLEKLDTLLSTIESKQETLSNSIQKSKTLGQYFTNKQTAQLISQLISIDKKEVALLDAGSGVGILTIASIIELVKQGCQKIKVTIYEIDESLISILNNHLTLTKDILKNSEINLDFSVLNSDFVNERPDINTEEKFDIAVLNPPYFKVNTKSPYFNITKDLYSGNPNIYASFVAICLNLLIKNGQLVAITPRSFTNGLYFHNFRNFILKNSSLEKLHTFVSRGKLFKKVLQEVIIYKLIKDKQQRKQIDLGLSHSHEDYNNSDNLLINSSLIIDYNSNNFIRIPESEDDVSLLNFMGKLANKFSDLGYFISTGEVVKFRTKEYLTNNNSDQTIDVILPKDVNPNKNTLTSQGSTYFKKLKNYERHLTQKSNYLLLRRFSTKDDKKRLIASILLAKSNSKNLIGIDNHVNYIGFEKKGTGLPKPELWGLFAIFNSSIYEKYFRCISGNTQVNATEIRQMRFPEKKTIINIGNDIIKLKMQALDQEKIDLVVNSNLWKN